jgi:hypothetical protein
MRLRIVLVSVLALAGTALSRYFLNNGLVTDAGKQNHHGQTLQEADQRNKAKEAEEHREAELLHCIAVAEAEYVSALDREYNNAKAHGTFKREGEYDLNPEIHHRIERRKEISESDCQKTYGQTPTPSP